MTFTAGGYQNIPIADEVPFRLSVRLEGDYRMPINDFFYITELDYAIGRGRVGLDADAGLIANADLGQARQGELLRTLSRFCAFSTLHTTQYTQQLQGCQYIKR
jgi:hypothetical protein